VDLDPLIDRGDAIRASSRSAGRHDDAFDERCGIERLLMALRPAAGRTSREIYELYRAAGIRPPEPGQRWR
jgi:hypothetical protein